MDREAQERKRRVFLTLCAWAYEVKCPPESLTDDHNFDLECSLVDLTIETGRPDLDSWWRANFDPCTGSWIHAHPELDKCAALYQRLCDWDVI